MTDERMVHKTWTGKTDGTPWMQRSLTAVMRVIPREVPYAVMSIVILFYMLINRKGYRAMRDFYRKRMDLGVWRAWGMTYANYFRFGQVVIDRFAAFAGKTFHFEVEGKDLFERLERQSDGFVLLSAHVGNYEMAGYSLSPDSKQFYALVYAGETAEMMKNRSRMFERHRIQMVPMDEDMSHLFTMNAALNAGDIVSMPADRIFGSQKSIPCMFFGGTARFPMGPFALAVQKEVPALAVFVTKETTRRYHILLQELTSGDEKATLRCRVTGMAQQYATVLEKALRRYPAQWFNYYDFWDTAKQ